MLKKIIKLLLLASFIWIGYQVIYTTPAQKNMNEKIAARDINNEFFTGFEQVISYTELFNQDWSLWHELLMQNNEFSIRRPIKYCLIVPASCFTNSKIENALEIDNRLRRSGKNSLKFKAQAFNPKWFSDSRIAIRRQLIDYGKGDDLYFSGWFYFQAPEGVEAPLANNLDQLQFLSFRSTNNSLRKYGEPAAALFFSGRNYLGLKFDNWLPAVKEKHQDLLNRVLMPLDEWVQIKVHLKLSDVPSEGVTEVWLNDEKIIAERGQNLPTAKMKYSILEVGIGSNLNQDYAQTLYVDNLYLSPLRFQK